MYKNQLGVYHLMIVSKFFNTIEDFINLEIATPKAKGNMSKFHFNPVPLDKWSRQFFTSLETLYIYNPIEKFYFENERFYRKIIWCPVDCKMWQEYHKEDEEYQQAYYNQSEYEEIPDGVTSVNKFSLSVLFDEDEFIIPNTVTSMKEVTLDWSNSITKISFSTRLQSIENCIISHIWKLKKLMIPDSVTLIGGLFLECANLTALIVPTHWKQVGDCFINNNEHFSLFRIPFTIKTINGKEVDIRKVKEFNIPTYVTRLANYCFKGCEYTKITIPTSIRELPIECFSYCHQLQQITIPSTVTKLGNWCFAECTSLTALDLPQSLLELGQFPFFCMESLKEIEIPSSITKFGPDLCCYCHALTSVTLHTNYNAVECQDFYQCILLPSITLPTSVTRIGSEAFVNCDSLTSINLSELSNRKIIYEMNCFSDSGITNEQFPHIPKHCFLDY